MKAQAVFEKHKVGIKETVDARKEPLADNETWKLLQNANEIIVGRGKKYLLFKPSKTNKKEILHNCLGRTGNLRAPALRIDKKYIIGFTEDMYKEYLTR